MDRRHLLVAGLAGLFAGPALAQNNGAAAPASGAMGEAERDYVHNTLQVGGMSLAAAQYAVAHATQAKVKEFAKFEVAEQETIGAILKPLAGGAAPVDPTQAALMKRLADAGARLDVEFITAQIDGHDKLLKIQESYIASGRDKALADGAKLARGMIQEHLTLLNDLKSTSQL